MIHRYRRNADWLSPTEASRFTKAILPSFFLEQCSLKFPFSEPPNWQQIAQPVKSNNDLANIIVRAGPRLLQTANPKHLIAKIASFVSTVARNLYSPFTRTGRTPALRFSEHSEL